MSYTPVSVEGDIPRIAEECTKEIRHMDVITHDPEGQRIKGLVTAALWEFWKTLSPKDDGTTTHVTKRENIEFAVHGLEPEQLPPASSTGRPAEVVYNGLCHKCNRVHDPRLHYDHAPVPKGVHR